MVGVFAVLFWQVAGWVRVLTFVRNGRAPREGHWETVLNRSARMVGVRRPVKVIVCSQISAPATWGWFRPVILLPERSERWIWERREVVLLHELVHVMRIDWPLRMLARLAAAVYWFNPLSWWALRRLHLEQEYACDEEVIALGTKPSTYASHLLDIARSVIPQPMLAVAALGMARRSKVEGRIMAILERKIHRRVSLLVLIPAAICTAVLVSVFAAVTPSFVDAQPLPVALDRDAREASPALKDLIKEMNAVEKEMEVHLEKIEEFEVEMEPLLARIEEMEFEIDEEQLAHIEEQMVPYHEQMEKIHEQMEPVLKQIEELEIHIEPFHLDQAEINIGDLKLKLGELGTETVDLGELMDLVHQQLEPMQREIERMHEAMEPHLEQLEHLHEQLEPFQEKMEAIHLEMEPLHEHMEKIHEHWEPMIEEQMEQVHEALAPFHEQMEAIQLELEPFQDRLEKLADQVEDELIGDIETVLRNELGSFVTNDADFRDAAEELLDRAHMHIDDDRLELDISARKAERILTKHFEASSTVADGEFAAAVKRAASEVSEYTVIVE
jgi:predicted  nucleic acid-binding Zn-ribbon protein